MQVVGGDDRHVRARRCARTSASSVPSGSWSSRRQAGAVQHADRRRRAVPPRADPASHCRHHAIEERLLHRPVRLRHRQQDRHRLPRARRVHVGDEAGQFAQHARRGRPRFGQHRVAARSACARRNRPRSRSAQSGCTRWKSPAARCVAPVTARPPAAPRSAALPSARCRSAPAPWSAPARPCRSASSFAERRDGLGAVGST